MMFVRPVKKEDLEPLLRLSKEAGVGLTTLPPNQAALRKKIDWSLRSFLAKLQGPENEYYLFVLEDSNTSRIVGVTGIISSVGVSQPFYTFRLSTSVLHSNRHQIHSRYRMLNLVNDFTGVSEICTLYLSPEYRQSNNGKLLSRCRFLFFAQFPERIADIVIAEMRGQQDKEGRSPFWQNLGMRFFKMDFSKADYLSAMEDDFITDLMPRQPFYEEMLPEEAQKVIGQVHKNTMPALKMLEKEGFSHDGYVDIFDAGPTVNCHTKNIHSVRNSITRTVRSGVPGKGAVEGILCNQSLKTFRSVVSPVGFPSKSQITLPAKALKSLNLQEGDSLRFIPLRY